MLQVFLFGSVKIYFDENREEIKLTPVVQNLLAYLMLQRHRTLPRELLAGVFWGDFDQGRARSCLNTTLWRLRRCLEPQSLGNGRNGNSDHSNGNGNGHNSRGQTADVEGGYIVTTPSGEIGVNAQSRYWLDVAVFEDHINRILVNPPGRADETQIGELEYALSLYTGELLEGVYEDWALREREHQRRQYLNSLDYLMRYYHACGQCERSLDYGLKILGQDPLREEIHREVMRLYLETGRRTLAIRQYEICQVALAEELGIPPMEETQELYRKTIEEGQPSQVPWDEVQAADLNRTLYQLQKAARSLAQAQQEMQQTLAYIQKLTNRRS
jgi:DNA-binding SARP family transcriptional activator